MIDVLILDFDGVILESVEVKTEAFRELFSFAPDHVEEIVEFHRQNGGMSRYDKIRHIYAEILDEPLSEGRFSELVDRFSGLVLEGVLASPPVGGVEEFLECYSSKIPIYIVSATPEAEIREIVRRRGMDRYFKHVYGSPRPKSDCIREILNETCTDPDRALFVGDAPNDWKAAREVGTRFIARIKPGDPDRFADLIGIEAKVQDLSELHRYLEGRV